VSQVKEVSLSHRVNVSVNAAKNREIIDYYQLMAVVAVRKKTPRREVDVILSRKKRMENCNKFWQMEVYENSKVKLLLRTFLCRDKFCYNCKRVKQLVQKRRFLPLMEQYSNSLYHVTLTVPACAGEALGDVLRQMARCFKILVTYLNGNKKISGLDFMAYGFKGGIRSLEIDYDGDVYHPHYHVAAVFDNPVVVEQKSIENKFSMSGRRLFSEFESILQRMWWLLMNGQRLSYANITSKSAEDDRYSCVMDSFHPDNYGVLFDYMTKIRSEKDDLMEYENFTTLYHALNGLRQIQGYGTFYNVKAAEDDQDYTEQEYRDIADYITSQEQPKDAYEPVSRLANDTTYTVIRSKYTGKKP
jgi:hypothetical protein